VWGNPALIIPGEADKLNLQNFNNVLNTAIRQVDNDTMVFFEVRRGGEPPDESAHRCFDLHCRSARNRRQSA